MEATSSMLHAEALSKLPYPSFPFPTPFHVSWDPSFLRICMRQRGVKLTEHPRASRALRPADSARRRTGSWSPRLPLIPSHVPTRTCPLPEGRSPEEGRAKVSSMTAAGAVNKAEATNGFQNRNAEGRPADPSHGDSTKRGGPSMQGPPAAVAWAVFRTVGCVVSPKYVT